MSKDERVLPNLFKPLGREMSREPKRLKRCIFVNS